MYTGHMFQYPIWIFPILLFSCFRIWSINMINSNGSGCLLVLLLFSFVFLYWHQIFLSSVSDFSLSFSTFHRCSLGTVSNTTFRSQNAMYVGWSFNSGTDFFVSEWTNLTANWSCLLQSSVLMLVCTYSSVPATDESTSGSHFLSWPSVVSSRWLESFQRNRIGDLSLFSSVAGTRRSRMEQGQGRREGVGVTKGCVLPEIHLWWQPCGQGHFHGAGSNCRSATSRGEAMSAHSAAEALQNCFVEFLIYRQSSRDVLMMKQPVNVEERSQHGLDFGLYLPCFLRSRR